MGFVAPERLWLANELKPWINDLIHSQTFRTRPYFDVNHIEQAFDAHVAGSRDLSKLAWRWINLELWLQQMIEGKAEQP